MQKEIRKTWFFNHPPQKVWECLTQPELLEQWLGPTDFQPIVGFKFRFISPYGNDSYCEVLEVEPFTSLSYSWQKRSLNDNKPFTSKVTWTLVPAGEGTELQLVHDGFVAADDLAGHETGWSACLKRMEDLLRMGH